MGLGQKSGIVIESDQQKDVHGTNDAVVQWLETHWIILFGVLLAILAFLAFYRLGAADIQPWDEARHGISGYEMLQTKDFIRSTYRYSADYYNLKPPLSNWLIAGSYSVFGYNAFAMRFYSALSYLLTSVIIALWLKRKHGAIASLVSLLLFLFSFDVLSFHMVRSGDPDALFILFYTISILSTLRYIERERPLDLYIASLAFAFAFLTKSFHAGCIVVTMAVLLLWARKMKTLTLKTWLLSIFFALAPILIWGVARYLDDGTLFLQKMFAYDLFTRSTTAIEGHGGSFMHYVRGMSDYLSVWTLGILLLIAFGTKILQKAPLPKRTALYLIWIIVPIALFFFVKTKLLWYIYPANVALIALSAVMFEELMKAPKARMINRVLCAALVCTMLFGIASNINVMQKTKNQDSLQVFINRSIDRNSDYSGQDCYIDSGDWAQDHVLAAELAGDLKCIDGGMELFQAEQTSALFIVTDRTTFDLAQHPDWEVLAATKQYLLITQKEN